MQPGASQAVVLVLVVLAQLLELGLQLRGQHLLLHVMPVVLVLVVLVQHLELGLVMPVELVLVVLVQLLELGAPSSCLSLDWLRLSVVEAGRSLPKQAQVASRASQTLPCGQECLALGKARSPSLHSGRKAP